VIATPICFEATKPALCRWLVRQAGSAPHILINLTNDGWFGAFDAARWQHMQISRWRAVELDTPVVRAANTGVSAAIDARGRVLKAGVDGMDRRTQVDGVLTTDILLDGSPTIYARSGDVLGWSSLVATGLLLIAHVQEASEGGRMTIAKRSALVSAAIGVALLSGLRRRAPRSQGLGPPPRSPRRRRQVPGSGRRLNAAREGDGPAG